MMHLKIDPGDRICIDLDGTICEIKGDGESYSTVSPLPGARDALIAMRKQGAVLVIHTARRMRTHDGNLGAVLADIASTTLSWLDKHDIPYDEIYFGKPYAKYYIDDLGCKFHSWDKVSISR